MRFNGFEWDNGNLKKVQKHGLTDDEIEAFFCQKVLVIEEIEAFEKLEKRNKKD